MRPTFWVSFLSLLVVFLKSLLARLGLSGQVQVRRGLEEARVAVFLHQRVDFVLSLIERRLTGPRHVLPGDFFGGVVKVYLRKQRVLESTSGREVGSGIGRAKGGSGVGRTSRGASEQTNSL